MKKTLVSFLLLLSALSTAAAQSAGEPYRAYQIAANSESIGDYMNLFSRDMLMIDVGRRFEGTEAVRSWALAEVIPHGDSFRYLKTLASGKSYSKTLVRWLNFEALYYFWTDDSGKIRKMSLQYTRVGETPSRDVYAGLPAAVQLYFDGIRSGMDGMLEEAFTDSPSLRVVSRNFDGRAGILRFAGREVYGGEYELVELLESRPDYVSLHLRFKPKGWSRPEPDAVYRFYLKDGLIQRMDLQYK
jgi:hypothetical protein